ncbi:hypothetical protein [Lentzea sp.]|nr:hypothetical protein [Lentzea sp.]HUQ60413.1 hypothetical protein [Lentzea sp.]
MFLLQLVHGSELRVLRLLLTAPGEREKAGAGIPRRPSPRRGNQPV